MGSREGKTSRLGDKEMMIARLQAFEREPGSVGFRPARIHPPKLIARAPDSCVCAARVLMTYSHAATKPSNKRVPSEVSGAGCRYDRERAGGGASVLGDRFRGPGERASPVPAPFSLQFAGARSTDAIAPEQPWDDAAARSC